MSAPDPSPERSVPERIKWRSFRQELAAIIARTVNNQPVIITKHGEPQAVLISIELFQRWRSAYTSIGKSQAER